MCWEEVRMGKVREYCRVQVKGDAGFKQGGGSANGEKWLEIYLDGGTHGTCCWIVCGR